ncbi:MAG: 3-hydroxyisobutyrate dehydrogenase [Thermoleophilaceae bacterium]|nr:3-hydroxyisobutyrate dehydrogenase [Thermoleophilaceae bacterium]
MTVAVLGTGTMGAPIAVNVAAAGQDVRAWNRTADKAHGLEGVTACESIADAVSGAELVVTILSDGAAVEAVAGEALPALDDGAVWLQMSTVGIAAGERLAALAEEHGVPFVDAPVVGTKQPAEQGKLTVLASGPKDARERAKPVFDAVSAGVVELGDAGEGSALKVVVNSWLATLVAGLAETIALAEAVGIDPKLFLETIEGGPTGPQYAQLKGAAMIAGEYPTAFALSLTRKDVGLVLEAAESHGFDAPLARTIAELFDRAIEAGHGDADMAAVIEAYR